MAGKLKAMNVRGMSEELVRRAKVIATKLGITLREFVSEAMKREIERREASK